MDKSLPSRAAYVGPPPPRNYSFKHSKGTISEDKRSNRYSQPQRTSSQHNRPKKPFYADRQGSRSRPLSPKRPVAGPSLWERRTTSPLPSKPALLSKSLWTAPAPVPETPVQTLPFDASDASSSSSSSSESSSETSSDYDQDEIEEQIDRIDNEISVFETQLASVRAKAKAAAAEPLETIVVETVKERAPKKSWEDLEPLLDSKALVARIYADNRRARSSPASLFPLQGGETVSAFYTRFEDFDFYKKDLERHLQIQDILVHHLARQRKRTTCKLTSLALEYKNLQKRWTQKVDRWVAKAEKKKKAPPSGLGVSISASGQTPELAKPSPVLPSSRNSRRSGFRSDYVKSESELASALIALGVDPSEVDLDVPKVTPRDDPERLAIEPCMVLDPTERQLITGFQSTLGKISDPVADLANFNASLDLSWSDEEREIFKARLLQHGKNFRKIASFLPTKSTTDCVQYYYREKINLGFKQAIRRGVNAGQRGNKRGRRGKEAADFLSSSFRIWVLAPDEELPIQRQGLLQPLSWESSDQSKDVVVPEEDSVSPWTEEERIAAIEAFEQYARDFAGIAQLLGTKTEDQVRNFYNNHKRRQIRMEKKRELDEAKSRMQDTEAFPKRRDSLNEQDLDADSMTMDDSAQSTVPEDMDRELSVEFLADADSKKRKKKGGRIKKEFEEGLERAKKKSRKRIDGEENGKIAGNLDESGARRTISYWSFAERAGFLKALTKYGRDWDAIAKFIGTKSTIQARNYYTNFRVKLNLDKLLEESGKANLDEQPDVDAVTSNGAHFPPALEAGSRKGLVVYPGHYPATIPIRIMLPPDNRKSNIGLLLNTEETRIADHVNSPVQSETRWPLTISQQYHAYSFSEDHISVAPVISGLPPQSGSVDYSAHAIQAHSEQDQHAVPPTIASDPKLEVEAAVEEVREDMSPRAVTKPSVNNLISHSSESLVDLAEVRGNDMEQ